MQVSIYAYFIQLNKFNSKYKTLLMLVCVIPGAQHSCAQPMTNKSELRSDKHAYVTDKVIL